MCLVKNIVFVCRNPAQDVTAPGRRTMKTAVDATQQEKTSNAVLLLNNIMLTSQIQ